VATTLITGASSGLGAEFARRYAADGHDLLLVARRGEPLRALTTDLSARHSIRAEWASIDLSSPDGARSVVEAARQLGLAVDVLVNNAGFGLRGPFATTPANRELAMIQLNVMTLVHLTKLLLPAMVTRGHGHVVNIASTAAFQPGPGMNIYYATKAFVLSFSEALAEELRGSGVAVSTVCFGPVPTGFQDVAGQRTGWLYARTMMDAPRAVDLAYRAVRRRRRLIIPGLLNRLLIQAQRVLPRSLVTRAVRSIAG
jgi:short-subunit dehydrogenase